MHRKTRQFLTQTILTTAELAARTGVKEATIKKWVERGKIDCVKKGRTYLFDMRDLPINRRG